MTSKLLLFVLILTGLGNAQTLTLLSGNGQLLSGLSADHGVPIVFQLTSGGVPLSNQVITFKQSNGSPAYPLSLTTNLTDANGMLTVAFIPGIYTGNYVQFTLNASAPGSNVVVFYETVANFPPTVTTLVTPGPNALYPFTASAQQPGAPFSVNISSLAPLPNISLSIVTVPVANSSPPPGTILESVSCSVNGVNTPQVLSNSAGVATCIPVFAEPSSSLNPKYDAFQIHVLVGGNFYFGPYPYNILAAPPIISTGPHGLLVLSGNTLTTQIGVTGGTPPFTFALAAGSGPLPSGVSLTPAGQITGVPTVAGLFPFTVQVTDATGKVANSATLAFSLAVSGGLFTTSPSGPVEALVGKPYSDTILLTGGVPPYKISVGGTLPTGLTDVTGGTTGNSITISGTPTTVGSSGVSILGLDAANEVIQVPLTVAVEMALSAPPATLPLSVIGTAYSLQLQPTGGVAPFAFSASTIPAGLTVSPGGLLSGTPTAAPGLYPFTLTITDGASESVSTPLILPVSGGTPSYAGTVVLANASATLPYTAQIPNPVGGVPPYNFALTGPASPTLLLSRAGVLSGSFATTGTQMIPFAATDSSGETVSGTLQVSVVAPVPTISGITNAATSVIGSIAPGELVAIYGTDLGPTPGVPATVVNGSLPTTANGAQVTFGQYSAPILFTAEGQLNAVVPFEVTPGTTIPVTVTFNGAVSTAFNAAVVAEAPAIFLTGTTQGAILNSNASLNGPANAAKQGDFITIYANGSGPLTPPLADGQVATTASTSNIAGLTVTIGGVQAEVLYAGAAPDLVAGVIQINVIVPTSVVGGPSIPVVVTSGTVSSSSESATVAITP